jgi:hypothetical protein
MSYCDDMKVPTQLKAGTCDDPTMTLWRWLGQIDRLLTKEIDNNEQVLVDLYNDGLTPAEAIKELT